MNRMVRTWIVWSDRFAEAARSAWSPWILAASFLLTSLVTGPVLVLLTQGGQDVREARELGIISVSVQQGHSKSADVSAYFIGLAFVATATCLLWCAWAILSRRSSMQAGPVSDVRPSPQSTGSLLEYFVVALILFVGFMRFDAALNGFKVPWAIFAEEGEMMAWLDAMLRGRVLCRDIFCLYGPFSAYPVAMLFRLLGPSLHIWRLWFYALNVVSLIVYYAVLRVGTRSRTAAMVGVVLIATICCAEDVPAMSWSLARPTCAVLVVSLACLGGEWRRSRRLWGAGALLGFTLFFSQEAGLAAAIAVLALPLIEAVSSFCAGPSGLDTLYNINPALTRGAIACRRFAPEFRVDLIDGEEANIESAADGPATHPVTHENQGQSVRAEARTHLFEGLGHGGGVQPARTASHAPAEHPVTHEKGGPKARQWIAAAVRPWLGVGREPSPEGAAQTRRSGRGLFKEYGSLVVGLACFLVPYGSYLASRGALYATIENLFFFGKVRLLGFGGLPIPGLLTAFSGGASWLDVARIYVCPFIYAVSLSICAWRFLVRRHEETDSFVCGLTILGILMYNSALSRPDAAHIGFAAPPAILLWILFVIGAIRRVWFEKKLYRAFGARPNRHPVPRPDGRGYALAGLRPSAVGGEIPSSRSAGLQAGGVYTHGADVAPHSLLRGTSEKQFAYILPFLLFLAFQLAVIAPLMSNAAAVLASSFRQARLTLTMKFTGPIPPGARELRLERAGGVRIPASLADDLESVVQYLQKVTKPGESFWACPNEPLINFLADRPLANRFPLGLFAVTRTQREQLVAELEVSRPAYAVAYEDSVAVDGIAPKIALPELVAYLHEHYEPVERFGRMTVLRRWK
jgi:hypothetical protein